MGITITDVARRAGVSVATVSRVLSGSDSVRPETRRRVEVAIDELDYRPSAVARSLRQQATATIGLIVTDIRNPFYPELVRGVEDVAYANELSVLLCNSGDDPSRETACLDLMVDRRVDAIVVGSGGLARRQRDRLRDMAMPVVLANAALDDAAFPAVISDDRRGGELAARHVVEQGYDHVVHLAGPAEAGEASARISGVRAVVGDDVEVLETDGTLDGGMAGARRVMDRLRDGSAVIAHNDLTAIGAMSALKQAGRAVPEEVGVIGFDDIAMSAHVSPALSTIVQDKYGMGAWAARAAQHLLAGEQVEGTTVLPVELVARESTGRGPRE